MANKEKDISRRRVHAEKHGILREISFLGNRSVNDTKKSHLPTAPIFIKYQQKRENYLYGVVPHVSILRIRQKSIVKSCKVVYNKFAFYDYERKKTGNRRDVLGYTI